MLWYLKKIPLSDGGSLSLRAGEEQLEGHCVEDLPVVRARTLFMAGGMKLAEDQATFNQASGGANNHDTSSGGGLIIKTLEGGRGLLIKGCTLVEIDI